ncbi:MAG TPA: 2-dehydropantoate 2-reductase [Anaerolineales bacterium]|nr:2-dehydropantoate 2-reductase [Anaerolineales bacterium]
MILPLSNTPQSPPLKVLSFGAGAIGTYIGGSLALNGHRVVYLERPDVALQLNQQGMKLEIAGVIHELPNPTIVASLDTALELGPFDIALFALKSFDTRPALESMQTYHERLPGILCLQNGVENEAVIAEFLGKERVIAATVTSAIGKRETGHIVLERMRGSGVAAGHPLSSRLAQAMHASGLNTWLFSNAENMKWSKMLTNLLANATSAILDMAPSEIFAHPGLYRLELAQLRETLQVMRALGIQAVDLPATPVRLLAFSIRWLPAWLSRPLLGRSVGSGRGQKMPSFHIDFHSGRGKSEVDYLNGAVVRHGERLGIPTPANRVLNETLNALTENPSKAQDFNRKPEALLKLFDESRSA